MAERARFAKLEAAIVKMQKVHSEIEEHLCTLDNRMLNIKENMDGYKESFKNMEEMMKQVLLNQDKRRAVYKSGP